MRRAAHHLMEVCACVWGQLTLCVPPGMAPALSHPRHESQLSPLAVPIRHTVSAGNISSLKILGFLQNLPDTISSLWCEVYNTTSGKRVKSHRIGDGTIRGLVLSPSGDQMAIMLSDRVTIVALPSCTQITTVVTGGAAPLDSIGLFDAGGKLVTFEGDHRAIFAE